MGTNKLVSSRLKNSSEATIIKHLSTVVVEWNTAYQKQPVHDVYFQAVQLRVRHLLIPLTDIRHFMHVGFPRTKASKNVRAYF